MHYQRNQFFSVKQKPKETVTFLKDEKDDKAKQDQVKKGDQVLNPQEIELENKDNGDDENKQQSENGKQDRKTDKKQNKQKKQHTKPEELEAVKKFNKNIDVNYLLRRWDVKFLDIKVENLQKEAIDIFLVFKIGEKSKIPEDEKRNKMETRDADIVDNSMSYKQFKSEIVKQIEKESLRKVKLFIETEIHCSYNMLRQRSLVIEVWEYSRWSLNKFLGVYNTKLETIAQGYISQCFNVRRAGKNASFLRLFFTCYFQEIWDFRLDFENLKGFNTIDESRKPIASILKLTLMNDKKPSLKTVEHPSTLNPNWGYIQDFIHFRGTLDDLTDNLLQVKNQICQIKVALVQANGLSVLNDDKKTLVTLRGIHRFNQLAASIKVKVNKSKSKKVVSQEVMDTEAQEEDRLEQLNEEEVYTYIEGRINLNQIPRYIQQGELVRYKKDQNYLCIVINRVSHISAPDDRGLINSYVVISCGSAMKQTRTVKDQMNPDFNEEMVFKLPISKSSSLFDKVNIVNIVQSQSNNENVDSMRDEISKRSEVGFQLWVEGNQITSDDNLGYASFNVSELASSYTIEDKEVVDFDTKERIKHKIKVGNFTKNFSSGRFDASRITVSFLAYFMPPLPDSIDLRDFSKTTGDIYPYDIKDKMRVLNNNFQNNMQFQKWEQKIKLTFKQWNLKKNEIAIFLKNIWIKDHYNKIHFICKFLDSFTIQDMSYEDSDENDDTLLETMQDLAHYTRCIPFVENDYNEIWYSPDFFLSLRRGSVIDHALLLCSLFMGSGNLKKSKEDIKQDEFPIEDRVFVCLGTNSLEYIVAWVMVYDKDFSGVTFWDVRENKKWELKGRVSESEATNLKAFLNPSFKDQKKSKLNMGIFGFKNKKEREHEKQMKLQQQLLLEQKKKEDEEREEQKRQEEEQDQQDVLAQQKDIEKVINTLQKEPKSESKNKNSGIAALLSKDDSIKNNQIFSAEEIEKGARRTQLKQLSDLSTQNNTISDQPTSKTMQPNSVLQSQINDRKTFQKTQNEANQSKKTFLDAHKDEMIKLQDQGELTKFKKIEEFPGEREGEFDELPYKSVQIVFNHKNVYANLCNQSPIAIYYHLHDPMKWHPYLEHNTQKLGSFYLPLNPYPKMSKQAGDTAFDSILSDIKDGVNNIRSNEGLQTQWKSVLDPTSKLLRHYARCLEYMDKEKKMKVLDPKDKKNKIEMTFEELKSQFEKDMKNLMPTNYSFQCLPMKFLFIEKSQIRALIEEKAKQFFLLKKKHIIFGIHGKIFRYPNKINCLRVVIGIYYSNLDNMANDKEGENDKLKVDNEILEEDEDNYDDDMDSQENFDEQQDENGNLKKYSTKSKR